MLFRNYNWPKSVAHNFDSVIACGDGPTTRGRRPLTGSATTLSRLESVTDPAGQKYDFSNRAAPPAGQSSSFQKFIAFDKNFAHLWFFHEIVGIKYFSSTLTHTAKRYVKDRSVRFIHDRNPHGSVFENTFPLAEAGRPPSFNLPEEGSLRDL